MEFVVPRYLGGRGESVVVIDCENRFDMQRFGGLLKERVEVGWKRRFGGSEENGEIVWGSPTKSATKSTMNMDTTNMETSSTTPLKKPPSSKSSGTPKTPASFAKVMQQLHSQRGLDENMDPQQILERIARTSDEPNPDATVDPGLPSSLSNGPGHSSKDPERRKDVSSEAPQRLSTEQSIRKIYFECLDRILVYAPGTPLAALCTVMNLYTLFESNGNVGCLLIDAVTSFNHIETEPDIRAPSGSLSSGTKSPVPGSGGRPPPRDEFPRQLAIQLRTLLDAHPVFVFASCATGRGSGGKGRGLGSLVNHAVSLERGTPPRIDAGGPTTEQLNALPTNIFGRVRSAGSGGYGPRYPGTGAEAGTGSSAAEENFGFPVSRSEKLTMDYLVY